MAGTRVTSRAPAIFAFFHIDHYSVESLFLLVEFHIKDDPVYLPRK